MSYRAANPSRRSEDISRLRSTRHEVKALVYGSSQALGRTYYLLDELVISQLRNGNASILRRGRERCDAKEQGSTTEPTPWGNHHLGCLHGGVFMRPNAGFCCERTARCLVQR